MHLGSVLVGLAIGFLLGALVFSLRARRRSESGPVAPPGPAPEPPPVPVPVVTQGPPAPPPIARILEREERLPPAPAPMPPVSPGPPVTAGDLLERHERLVEDARRRLYRRRRRGPT